MKGICFDLDGTLTHTSFNMFKLSNITKMINPDYYAINDDCLTYSDCICSFFKHNKMNLINEFNDSILHSISGEELFSALEIRPIGAASSVLTSLKNCGFKIGLLTNSSREMAIFKLNQCLFPEFDAIIAYDDFPTSEAKPNPVSLCRLAKALEIESNEMIYVGDDICDYQVAMENNVPFIGVESGCYSRNDWIGLGKDIVHITDVDDLLSVLYRFI